MTTEKRKNDLGIELAACIRHQPRRYHNAEYTHTHTKPTTAQAQRMRSPRLRDDRSREGRAHALCVRSPRGGVFVWRDEKRVGYKVTTCGAPNGRRTCWTRAA